MRANVQKLDSLHFLIRKKASSLQETGLGVVAKLPWALLQPLCPLQRKFLRIVHRESLYPSALIAANYNAHVGCVRGDAHNTSPTAVAVFNPNEKLPTEEIRQVRHMFVSKPWRLGKQHLPSMNLPAGLICVNFSDGLTDERSSFGRFPDCLGRRFSNRTGFNAQIAASPEKFSQRLFIRCSTGRLHEPKINSIRRAAQSGKVGIA